MTENKKKEVKYKWVVTGYNTETNTLEKGQITYYDTGVSK